MFGIPVVLMPHSTTQFAALSVPRIIIMTWLTIQAEAIRPAAGQISNPPQSIKLD